MLEFTRRFRFYTGTFKLQPISTLLWSTCWPFLPLLWLLSFSLDSPGSPLHLIWSFLPFPTPSISHHTSKIHLLTLFDLSCPFSPSLWPHNLLPHFLTLSYLTCSFPPSLWPLNLTSHFSNSLLDLIWPLSDLSLPLSMFQNLPWHF